MKKAKVITCAYISRVIGFGVYPDTEEGGFTGSDVYYMSEYYTDNEWAQVTKYMETNHPWIEEITEEQARSKEWRTGTLVDLLNQHGRVIEFEVSDIEKRLDAILDRFADGDPEAKATIERISALLDEVKE